MRMHAIGTTEIFVNYLLANKDICFVMMMQQTVTRPYRVTTI